METLHRRLAERLLPLAVVLIFLGFQWRFGFLPGVYSYLLALIVLSEYLTLQAQAVFAKVDKPREYFGFIDYRLHALSLLVLLLLSLFSSYLFPIALPIYAALCLLDFTYRFVYAFKEVITEHGIRKASAAQQ